MFKKGFTLSEALIALAIIGFVALTVLPVTITNYKQQEYKIGLKKAVTVLNGAISLNIAKGLGDAYKADSLLSYLIRSMEIISSTNSNARGNIELETIDGMIFELPNETSQDFGNVEIKRTNGETYNWTQKINTCGTKGLDIKGKTKNIQDSEPCVIIVDINGRKRPNRLTTNETMGDKTYIIITDETVIPYGNIAQRTLYE